MEHNDALIVIYFCGHALLDPATRAATWRCALPEQNSPRPACWQIARKMVRWVSGKRK